MRHRRLLGIGLSTVLATSVGGTPAAAAPPPAQPIVDLQDRVWLSGSTQVCVNAEFNYDVEIYRWGIRADGSATPLGQIPGSIRVSVSGGGGSGGSLFFFGSATFPVRFSSAGRYTITATATGTPSGPAGQVGSIPASLVV